MLVVDEEHCLPSTKSNACRRRRTMLVDEEELNRRRAELVTTERDPNNLRGYDRLYAEQVLQADQGCDFSMLQSLNNNPK